MPALATITSSPPKRATVASTALPMASRSVASAASPSVRAASNASGAWRSTSATEAPRA
jgi:hypothetical protein